MTLAEVSEELKVSAAQVYALVRTGDLPAIKIGGRGVWRVERSQLEEWISERYAATQRARGCSLRKVRPNHLRWVFPAGARAQVERLTATAQQVRRGAAIDDHVPHTLRFAGWRCGMPRRNWRRVVN